MLKPRPTRDPADTLAALLDRDPWATPMGLASQAVSRAQQAVKDLALAPESRRTLAPEAIAQLARARRFVFDARPLCPTQTDREQLVYLSEQLDACARELGFTPVQGERAVA